MKNTENTVPPHPSRSWVNIRRCFDTIITAAFSVFACMLPPAALGANPAEEMAKEKLSIGSGSIQKGIHGSQYSTALSSSYIRNSCCDFSSVYRWP
jgi:hypothetical protein